MALKKVLIQDYYHQIARLYHLVTGAKESYDYLCTQDPFKWENSFSQGFGTRMKTGNKNIFFIPKSKIPSGRKIAYTNPVCDYRPWKDDPNCNILTIDGDNLPYPSYSGSPDSTLLEDKIIFNSVISTPGSWFICAYIKDYFLWSPMERFQYIKITFLWIPEEIRTQYRLVGAIFLAAVPTV